MEWLTHIDVDEFLRPARPMGDILAEMSVTSLCGRIRPIEALAPPDGGNISVFKAMHVELEARLASSDRVFPRFGPYRSGGFLSHVAGKLEDPCVLNRRS